MYIYNDENERLNTSNYKIILVKAAIDFINMNNKLNKIDQPLINQISESESNSSRININGEKNKLKMHINEEEIQHLLYALYEKYGYDFREYSQAHIQRRIMTRMRIEEIQSVRLLKDKLINDESFAAIFLQDLSITVTEMFRDKGFYRSLREQVIPILKTYPFIKIWHAGCSTGEEAYSMAILLMEEGLYDRTTIYATDFNQEALDKAKSGIFTLNKMKENTTNYQLSGGEEAFSSYYTSSYDFAIMNQSLKKNIVWANHNLVTDQVFAESHLILCRNVLIYFNKELQNRVQSLFYKSLIHSGILCLGAKEGIEFTNFKDKYKEIDKVNKIYKKLIS